MTCRRQLIVLFIAACSALWSAPLFASPWAETDVFVDVDGAASMIAEGAVVVDARGDSDYLEQRIPTAAQLEWTEFVDGSTSGAIVDDDEYLSEVLQGAGISQNRPVVVYGNWNREDAWGEEGRIFWTLEYLGHSNVQILLGGIDAWRREGQQVAGGPALHNRARGDFEVERNEELRTSTAELTSAVGGEDEMAILDTRDSDEYGGEIKYGEQRGGHVPGAEHLWWKSLFDDDGDLLEPSAVREQLRQRGIDDGDSVAAYCTGGVRSGFVYAVLRALGYDGIANYDASMWEWTRRSDTPVE